MFSATSVNSFDYEGDTTLGLTIHKDKITSFSNIKYLSGETYKRLQAEQRKRNEY